MRVSEYWSGIVSRQGGTLRVGWEILRQTRCSLFCFVHRAVTSYDSFGTDRLNIVGPTLGQTPVGRKVYESLGGVGDPTTRRSRFPPDPIWRDVWRVVEKGPYSERSQQPDYITEIPVIRNSVSIISVFSVT